MRLQLTFSFFLVFLIVFSYCTQSTSENKLEISFNSKFYVALEIIGVQEPFEFNDYYANFSGKSQTSIECMINSDTTFVLEFNSNMPEEFYFDLEKTKIPYFSSLKDTIRISYDVVSKEVEYGGSNQLINEFLLSKRAIKEGIVKTSRILYHSYDMPYSTIYSKLDSLATLENDFLDNTQIRIPDWYRLLEIQNIEFKYAFLKLQIPSYRNYQKVDSKNIPSDEELSFLKKINLNSPYNQYLNEFHVFMIYYY